MALYFTAPFSRLCFSNGPVHFLTVLFPQQILPASSLPGLASNLLSNFVAHSPLMSTLYNVASNPSLPSSS